MKAKNVSAILFFALILTSCAPTATAISPTETAAPTSNSTSIPWTATVPATLAPETEAPASEPTIQLSEGGPWLVYLHNSPRLGYADVGPVPSEIVLMNEDGSGRTLITLPECYGQVNTFLLEGGDAGNYMADMGRDAIYIFRPTQATGMLVYQQLGYSICNTFFSGDETGGLLASIYQGTDDVTPELMIYELPSGNVRERIPLVRCPEGTNVCEEFRSNWGEMGRQQPQWSPNGRYLAFVAVLDAATSDLFLYDSQDGKLRRLTSGPDWVGNIEWSPDGTRIIMQELLNDAEFFFAPYSKPPSSVWSVSVSTNEIKLLYSIEDATAEQNILRWLDDKRFIAYEGSLLDPMYMALNPRFVDMETGTNRILFDDLFVMESFDPIHETLALFKLPTEKSPQGIYLVSIGSGTIHHLEEPPFIMNFPDWDAETGLFVSEDPCQNDPQSLQAFDYQGNFKCVPKPDPTPVPLQAARYPSPNGKWNLFIEDGLWLEADIKPAALVSQETASDVIWCPASTCFFFSVLQPNQQWTLYHVSLPDLTVTEVDEGIESTGSYQWLGGVK